MREFDVSLTTTSSSSSSPPPPSPSSFSSSFPPPPSSSSSPPPSPSSSFSFSSPSYSSSPPSPASFSSSSSPPSPSSFSSSDTTTQYPCCSSALDHSKLWLQFKPQFRTLKHAACRFITKALHSPCSHLHNVPPLSFEQFSSLLSDFNRLAMPGW